MGGQASIATVHIAFDQSVVQAGHVVTGTQCTCLLFKKF
jgi:hypothetical protein